MSLSLVRNKLLSIKNLKSNIFCQKHDFDDISIHFWKKYIHSVSTGNHVSKYKATLLASKYFLKVPLRGYTNKSEKRHISKTSAELWENLKKSHAEIENPKLIKVAIVGTPNSGKSTLTNAMCGVPICSASKRVHTTTYNANAVVNIKNVQIVFVDTPGAVFAKEAEKYHLHHSQMVDPMNAVLNTDLIAVLHDVSTEKSFSRVLSRRVIKLLVSNPLTPSILLLNKVDKLDNVERLPDFILSLTGGTVGGQDIGGVKVPEKKSDNAIRQSVLDTFLKDIETEPSAIPPQDTMDWDREQVLKGNIKLNEMQAATFARRLDSWPLFQNVYCISALHEWDLDVLKEDIINRAYSHPWMFPSNVVTDQIPEQLAVNIIRGACLQHINGFISYTVQIEIVHWEVRDDGDLIIKIELIFGKARHKKNFYEDVEIKVLETAEKQLRTIFNCTVKLYIESKLNSK